jgi:hypothetical protein
MLQENSCIITWLEQSRVQDNTEILETSKAIRRYIAESDASKEENIVEEIRW